MLAPAHAGLSWILANLGRGDHPYGPAVGRRFRLAVFLAGVLPDVDGIGLFFSRDAYFTWHHVLTHGIFFALALSLLGLAWCPRLKARVFLFTQAAFWLHCTGDYFFTRWELYLFYPLSRASFTYEHAVWLYHPINHVLAWLALAGVGVAALICRRTPLELLSGRLDRWLVAFLGGIPRGWRRLHGGRRVDR